MNSAPLVEGDVLSYVYLLRSLKDGKFYTGWTVNLKRRFAEHNAGLCAATKRGRPFKLVHYETYPSVEFAKNRERALRHNPRMLHYFKRRMGDQRAVSSDD